jgi:hypothetical protein
MAAHLDRCPRNLGGTATLLGAISHREFHLPPKKGRH